MVDNVLIEDGKDGGSKLDARAWENSEEKETISRKDNTKYISIALYGHPFSEYCSYEKKYLKKNIYARKQISEFSD